MFNFRLLLVRLRIHRLTGPFNRFILKMGNFTRLSLWIDRHQKLLYNDFYSTKGEYKKRYELYEYIIDNEINDLPINYMEFGVGDGETINWWAKALSNKNTSFYGFDTFEGLPEDWGIHKKGSFNNSGNIPLVIDERIKFNKGLFQNTLNPFLKEIDNDKKNVILLDADLYSSTLFVLTTIAPCLKKNDIIIFDEFLAAQHEFLAYYNFCESFSHIKLDAFAAANNYSFVAFKVV
jgi:O-methyltransferase